MVHLTRWTLVALFAGLAAGALMLGCEGGEYEPAETTEAQEPQSMPSTAAETQSESETEMVPTRAVAQLMSKSGSDLTGEAHFVEDPGGITFEVNVENVSPGMHAVHIHENGDCSTEDAATAGHHWNPTSKNHGKWGQDPFHLGDIGNIDVQEDGQGTLSITSDLWSLDENSESSVLGKSVVVHAGADDFTTQPDGASGDRIGCGVIELKKQT